MGFIPLTSAGDRLRDDTFPTRVGFIPTSDSLIVSKGKEHIMNTIDLHNEINMGHARIALEPTRKAVTE